jgi:hypothetical protein
MDSEELVNSSGFSSEPEYYRKSSAFEKFDDSA